MGHFWCQDKLTLRWALKKHNSCQNLPEVAKNGYSVISVELAKFEMACLKKAIKETASSSGRRIPVRAKDCQSRCSRVFQSGPYAVASGGVNVTATVQPNIYSANLQNYQNKVLTILNKLT